jgi:ribosomal protein L11 methyltransferase
MKWIELQLTIKHSDLEIATALLYDFGIEGFQIMDDSITDDDRKAMYVGYVEDYIKPYSEEVMIKCYFNQQADFESIHKQVLATFNDYYVPILVSDIAYTDEEDWAHKWKEFFKPFKIGDRIVVKPIWEIYEATADELIIEIDPGMAFGSGTHETTSMCALALEKVVKLNDHVLDVGCGSAILSIIAAKYGASEVKGIDIDANAIKIAKENVAHNKVEAIVEICEGDLLTQVDQRYDVVVANILAEVY